MVKRLYPQEQMSTLLLRFSLTLPIDIGATYLTVYVLFARFLLKRRYLAFSFSFLVSIVFFILLQRYITYYISQPLFYPGSKPTYTFWQANWFYIFSNIYLVVACFSVVKLLDISLRQQQHANEMSRERAEAELKFLKAQVHPHFLFNTLNNLYALTLVQSEKAPEVVLKLSGLLSYMLYECNDTFVLISKEIKLINDYIELERIRYGSHLQLEFLVSGETAAKKIAPLLLLPFVENAFKHGVSQIRENGYVWIQLEILENQLDFRVRNSRPQIAENDRSGYTEGIGLKTVSRRLQLMYPDEYQMNVESLQDSFQIQLRINLTASHEHQMPDHR
jgi:hypothetical protein